MDDMDATMLEGVGAPGGGKQPNLALTYTLSPASPD